MKHQELVRKDRIKCKCLRELSSVEVMEASYHKQSFSRHTHECYAFGVITGGRLDFIYQHKNWQANPGDINLVVPGEVHDGHGAMGGGWSYKMLYMPVEILREVNFEITGTDSLPYFLHGVISHNYLGNSFQSLHKILLSDEATFLQKDSMLRQWLTSFITMYSEPKTNFLSKRRQEDKAVRLTIDYLNEHYMNKISLKDLAVVAGLSSYYLLHVFKDVVGMPPHLYQQQLRVWKAKQLIAKKNSLAAISNEIGFADQSHFSRQFKKVIGLTPAQYQKMF
ncbi:MAG: transcriptional regulator, AraC family [Firmicutes bacterium]|nr:transcriptional regulator, AraC family [Bacillota bacterium]